MTETASRTSGAQDRCQLAHMRLKSGIMESSLSMVDRVDDERNGPDRVVQGRVDTHTEDRILDSLGRVSGNSEPHTDVEAHQLQRIEYLQSQEFQLWLRKQNPDIVMFTEMQYDKYAKWRNHAQVLQSQVEMLTAKLENASMHQFEKEKSAREFEKLKTKLENLQNDALSVVDRFQPATDQDITREFDGVKLGVNSIVSLLCKMKSTLSNSEWQKEMKGAMHPLSVDTTYATIEHNQKTVRKMALKNAVWSFFDTFLLGKTFGGYAGSLAADLRAAYEALFPEPCKDKESARWRSLTASRLENVQDQKAADELVEDVCVSFGKKIASRLGYPSDDGKLLGKVRETVVKAAAFSRFISQQRAIFELTFGDLSSSELTKELEDIRLINVEDDEEQAERSGRVWFVSRPGLIKRGNGVGDRLECSMTVVRANVKLADD